MATQAWPCYPEEIGYKAASCIASCGRSGSDTGYFSGQVIARTAVGVIRIRHRAGRRAGIGGLDGAPGHPFSPAAQSAPMPRVVFADARIGRVPAGWFSARSTARLRGTTARRAIRRPVALIACTTRQDGQQRHRRHRIQYAFHGRSILFCYVRLRWNPCRLERQCFPNTVP